MCRPIFSLKKTIMQCDSSLVKEANFKTVRRLKNSPSGLLHALQRGPKPLRLSVHLDSHPHATYAPRNINKSPL